MNLTYTTTTIKTFIILNVAISFQLLSYDFFQVNILTKLIIKKNT